MWHRKTHQQSMIKTSSNQSMMICYELARRGYHLYQNWIWFSLFYLLTPWGQKTNIKTGNLQYFLNPTLCLCVCVCVAFVCVCVRPGVASGSAFHSAGGESEGPACERSERADELGGGALQCSTQKASELVLITHTHTHTKEFPLIVEVKNL